MSITLDVLATKLPSIEFKQPKPKAGFSQRMQSLRGGRKFYLRTVPDFGSENIVINLVEYDDDGKSYIIGNRSAIFNNPESITKAIKSLERKAGCELYYVLLIDTDGNYL